LSRPSSSRPFVAVQNKVFIRPKIGLLENFNVELVRSQWALRAKWNWFSAGRAREGCQGLRRSLLAKQVDNLVLQRLWDDLRPWFSNTFRFGVETSDFLILFVLFSLDTFPVSQCNYVLQKPQVWLTPARNYTYEGRNNATESSDPAILMPGYQRFIYQFIFHYIDRNSRLRLCTAGHGRLKLWLYAGKSPWFRPWIRLTLYYRSLCANCTTSVCSQAVMLLCVQMLWLESPSRKPKVN
jgi:hypothetical protein